MLVVNLTGVREIGRASCYMRRLISLIGIMLLSLSLSGWGSVLAAAFCPHLASKNLTTKIMAGSCHQMSEEQSSHSASHEQAMNGMRMTAGRHDFDESVPVGQIFGTCSHCMDKEESPVAAGSSRELSPQKRDAGTSLAAQATLTASNTNFFQPKFIATQNAPPGAANRKHLIIGVFLI